MNEILEALLTNPFFHLVAIIGLVTGFVLAFIYWWWVNKQIIILQDQLANMPKELIDVYELNLLEIMKLEQCYRDVLDEKRR